MSVAANERFGVEPAPDGLALVQELLNTLAVDDHAPDLLADLDTAAPWAAQVSGEWAERTAQRPPDIALTVRDLPRLRALRSQLRDSLGTGIDHEAAQHATVTLTLTLTLGPAVAAVPAGKGSAWFTSAALLAAFLAQQNGTWTRLKTCRNDSCHVAFFDRTKNNNAVWHDFRYCGNAINLRASRARRKAASGS